MRRLFFLCLVALVLLAPICLADSAPVVGELAPPVSLPSLDGKNVSLSSFIGKPIILTFFASFSKPCKDELVALDQIKKANARVEIIAVSIDKKAKSVEDFLSENKVNLNFLFDKKLSVISKYSILILPTTYCINKEGKIDKIFVDFDDSVKKSISEWLKY